MCDVERIEKLARKYDLKVIYDAAHAFGVKYKGKSAAVYGDAAMFSFHATKVYNTIEGGAVCFESDDYGLDLYRIKNFGIRNEEVVDAVGANAKMNEFQAAMGICNLRHLDEEIAKRKIAHDIYIEQLKGIKGLYLPQQQENVESNYAYFPIRINENEFGMSRDALYLYLKEHGVFSRKYFYPLTNSFECYRDKFDVEKTPVALSVSNEVLTLPLYAELSEADVKKICKIIAQRAKA